MGIPQTVYPCYRGCTLGSFPVWSKSYCYRHPCAYSLVYRYTNFIWYTTGSENFGSQCMSIFNLLLPIISKVLISLFYPSSHCSTFSPTLSIMTLAFANLVAVQPNVFSRKYSWPLNTMDLNCACPVKWRFFSINIEQYCKCTFSPLWFS